MAELKTEKKRDLHPGILNQNFPFESKLQLSFLGLLSACFIGYFAMQSMQKLWLSFVFAHLAAVSIIGFFGCFTGAIAKKKGYSYDRAFKMGFFLPIILGVIAGFMLGPAAGRDLPFTCGGWVSLGAGILVVLACFLSTIRAKF